MSAIFSVANPKLSLICTSVIIKFLLKILIFPQRNDIIDLSILYGFVVYRALRSLPTVATLYFLSKFSLTNSIPLWITWALDKLSLSAHSSSVEYVSDVRRISKRLSLLAWVGLPFGDTCKTSFLMSVHI